jgi:hypothetical protein
MMKSKNYKFYLTSYKNRNSDDVIIEDIFKSFKYLTRDDDNVKCDLDQNGQKDYKKWISKSNCIIFIIYDVATLNQMKWTLSFAFEELKVLKLILLNPIYDNDIENDQLKLIFNESSKYLFYKNMAKNYSMKSNVSHVLSDYHDDFLSYLREVFSHSIIKVIHF